MLVWVFLLHVHVYYLIGNVWISHVSNHLVQNEIFVPFNGNDNSKRSPRMTQVFTWKHPKRLPDNCIYLIIPCLHKSVDVWRVALLTVHQNSIRTLNRSQPLSLGNTHGFTTMNPLELTHLHSCRPLLVLKPRLTPSRRWTPPPGPRCRNRDRSACLYTPVGLNKYSCELNFYPWRTQVGCLNILMLSTLIFNANSSISASGCARPSWREFVFGNNLSSKHAPDI